MRTMLWAENVSGAAWGALFRSRDRVGETYTRTVVIPVGRTRCLRSFCLHVRSCFLTARKRPFSVRP